MRTRHLTLPALALALALAAPALAQQPGTAPAAPPADAGVPAPTVGGEAAGAGAAATGETAVLPGTSAPAASWYSRMQSDQIVGQTVYGSDGKAIGEVENVVVNQQGKQAGAVIGVGGFLGLGERDVTIPLDQLQRGDDNRLKTAMTKEAIANLPEYQEGGDWMALGSGRTVNEGVGQ